MGKDEIIFFEGPCSHKVLLDVGEKIKIHLSNIVSEKTIKKVFASSNELVQNIGFYSKDKSFIDGNDIGIGKIRIAYDEDNIFVSAENTIDPEKGQELFDRIQRLNTLEYEELKSIYKEQLRNERAYDSKGAGLGFLEIIKITKNKILVNCEAIDRENTKITITSVIRREK